MDFKLLALLLVAVASSYAERIFQTNENKFSHQPQLQTQTLEIPTYYPRGRVVGDDWLKRRMDDGLSKSLHERIRRSPDDGKRGSVVLSGTRTEGQFGRPSQSQVRGEYNHNLWRGKNGATVDANAFYERNRGGGPKQDYGGGVRASIPFGRR